MGLKYASDGRTYAKNRFSNRRLTDRSMVTNGCTYAIKDSLYL